MTYHNSDGHHTCTCVLAVSPRRARGPRSTRRVNGVQVLQGSVLLPGTCITLRYRV